MQTPQFARNQAVLGAAAGLLLLGAQVRATLPFVADDALISLRYSQRLLEGQGLTFTAGEWVEGYSNLLMVLLCAALGGLGLDLIVAARVVGVVSAVGLISAVSWWSAFRGPSAAVAGGLLVGGTLSLGHWAVGGLEQALLAALVGGALVALLHAEQESSVRWSWTGGVLLGLASLTRPDAPIFAVVAALWLVPRGRRTMASVVAPVAVAVLGQLVFRLATYGEWVPNTAHAKLALSAHRLQGGAEYLFEGGMGLALLCVLALIGLWRGRARESTLLAGAIAAWAAYVVFIGGDIFPARRHFVVLTGPLCMLAAAAFSGLGRTWLVAVFAAGVGHVAVQENADRDYRKARGERWEWQCGVLASALGEAYRAEQPLLAVNAAGCWPYFSGLPSLDMLGLNDAHIAKSASPLRGQGHLGHELGDGAYVLSREPELIVFGTWMGSAKPGYYGDRQIAGTPSFRRDYRLIRLRAAGESALIWLRTSTGALSPRRSADAIVLPGHLFAKQGPGVVAVARSGQVQAQFTAGSQSQFTVQVPPGQWRGSLVGEGRARLRMGGGQMVDGATLAFDAPGGLTLTVVAETGFALTELRLEAVPQSASQPSP
ncbi:MAG: hypothetical protein KC912_00890 [Proteobacteria bacterium]|nr:hypothetical protein [Pseudomonadota bacterium]